MCSERKINSQETRHTCPRQIWFVAQLKLDQLNGAVRLEKLFGMDAQFWLHLQLAWDLYHATHSSTAKEIMKINRFPALAHGQMVHDAVCGVAPDKKISL